MAPFELSSWLSAQRLRVEGFLEARLAHLAAPPELAEAMAYSLRAGGKRLRPLLCLAVGERFPAPSSARLLEEAACALEFVHTYSLIHDDLPSMDNADLRRGKPTSHKRFSEALAILAGDALLTDAFLLLARGADAGEGARRAKMVSELAQAAGSSGMVGGQVLDISNLRPATEEALLHLHRLKTGALIRASCRLGALAVGAPDEALAAVTRYGECVGLAFQIADDLLDATVSPGESGKPSGQDAANERHTFLTVKGEKASRDMAHQLVRSAIEAICVFEPHGGPLTSLAAYCVERTA